MIPEQTLNLKKKSNSHINYLIHVKPLKSSSSTAVIQKINSLNNLYYESNLYTNKKSHKSHTQ